MHSHLKIGTSGFYYADWVGHFYPKSVKKEDYLSHYAKTFQTTELNTTFYHLPLVSTVKRWHDMTPDRFVFAVKAGRLITHYKRLLDCKEALAQYLKVVSHLKKKLGPILFQLPPKRNIDVVGLCLYDKKEMQSPVVITSATVYVRFHGTKPRYHGDYALEHLKPWSDRIQSWLADKKEVFVYFNNDYEGHAVKNANELLQQIEAVHA